MQIIKTALCKSCFMFYARYININYIMVNGIKTRKLMEVEVARKRVALDISLKRRITQDRKEVKDIISGKDGRLLVIVGPCSAWPSEAVRVYAEQLAELAKLYKNDVKIIMRVYTQKPRTTVGWAGVALQPDPFEAPNINAGTIYICEKNDERNY